MRTLRLARVLAGMNQTELAERLGMSQRQLSKVESGETPIPPEALVSVLAVLRALPKDTPEQRNDDFLQPVEVLHTEAKLIRDLVLSISRRMGSGESARILTEVCRVLLLRQQAILEALATRVEASPERAN